MLEAEARNRAGRVFGNRELRVVRICDAQLTYRQSYLKGWLACAEIWQQKRLIANREAATRSGKVVVQCCSNILRLSMRHVCEPNWRSCETAPATSGKNIIQAGNLTEPSTCTCARGRVLQSLQFCWHAPESLKLQESSEGFQTGLSFFPCK